LLKLAGYPYRANDLTVEEWEDLGRCEEMMHGREEETRLMLMQKMLKGQT
jgi:hypothetical protein